MTYKSSFLLSRVDWTDTEEVSPNYSFVFVVREALNSNCVRTIGR